MKLSINSGTGGSLLKGCRPVSRSISGRRATPAQEYARCDSQRKIAMRLVLLYVMCGRCAQGWFLGAGYVRRGARKVGVLAQDMLSARTLAVVWTSIITLVNCGGESRSRNLHGRRRHYWVGHMEELARRDGAEAVVCGGEVFVWQQFKVEVMR